MPGFPCKCPIGQLSGVSDRPELSPTKFSAVRVRPKFSGNREGGRYNRHLLYINIYAPTHHLANHYQLHFPHQNGSGCHPTTTVPPILIEFKNTGILVMQKQTLQMGRHPPFEGMSPTQGHPPRPVATVKKNPPNSQLCESLSHING